MKLQAVCLLAFVSCVSAVQKPAEPPVTHERVVIQVPLDNRNVSFGTIDDVQASVGIQGDCPDGMLYVDGSFCTKVTQNCKIWKEPPCSVSHKKGCEFARCAEFYPTVCSGSLIHKTFCIDRYEYTAPGETLPKSNVNYYQAENICKDEGKRLCKESEFNSACEGIQANPYPTGLDRPTDECNIDVEHNLGKVGNRNNLVKPSNSIELNQCVSPFGIANMVGNIDELTVRDVSPGQYHNALKGGWWGPIRARCRPATTAHSDTYSDIQVGFRCCKSVD